MLRRTTTGRKTKSLFTLALLVVLALIASACSSSSKSSSGGSSGGASSGASGSSSAAPTSLTATQIQEALGITKGTAGKADPSKSPVVLGYINQQGGTLSFPEATVAANATVNFINDQLGGIQGHPLKLVTCLAAGVGDGQKCGQQMANDSSVKAIVVPLLLLDNQALYAAVAGKKPILAGGLFFPSDLTTANVYSYQPSSYSSAKGITAFAQNFLHAKRVVFIRTDNPAGLAAAQFSESVAKAAGLKTADIPVPEPGTAPVYSAAIRQANIQPGDVIDLAITSVGAVSVYDALKTLNIDPKTIPVLGSGIQALSPMPGHLKDAGASDTVFPNYWYLSNAGYSEFMPVANTNGTDVFVAMMGQYAGTNGNIHGYAPVAFQEIMSLTRFYNQDGGADATSDQLNTSLKTWTGPAPLTAGPLSCGAIKASPNLCQFTIGYIQRNNGQWVSIADGLNGKAINTLTS